MASITPYSLPAIAQRRKSSSDFNSGMLYSHSPTKSGIKMDFPAGMVHVLSSLPPSGQPRTIQDLVDLLDISPVCSRLLDAVIAGIDVSNSTIWPAIYHKEIP